VAPNNGAAVIWAPAPREASPPSLPRIAVVDLDEELARHHQAAFGWALACCKWDRSCAEDVLQTAYLKIVDGRARFGGRGEFRAFLFGVIRHTARDERRRRAVRRLLPARLLGQAVATSTQQCGDESVARDERTGRLVAALDRLSARQREVLLLVFYHDLTIAAAADVLGVSIGTARIHYERGKAHLRRLLSEE
jgi:RNA polymerase sigma factor (sigma-70 family)